MILGFIIGFILGAIISPFAIWALCVWIIREVDRAPT